MASGRIDALAYLTRQVRPSHSQHAACFLLLLFRVMWQFGMTYTGFIVNGASGSLTNETLELYTSFSWDGFTEQTGYTPCKTTPCLIGGKSPLFDEWDLPGDPKAAAGVVLQRAQPGLTFQVYRTILQPPSYHASVVAAVNAGNANIKFVDIITMSFLARLAMGTHPTCCAWRAL